MGLQTTLVSLGGNPHPDVVPHLYHAPGANVVPGGGANQEFDG
jgi:hypothetical protein